MTHRVDELDDYEFVSWAETAAQQLKHHGHAFVSMSPGDATNYKIVVVRPLEPKMVYGGDEPVEVFEFLPEYWVGSTFGPLYQWVPSQGHVHWDYVADKWVPGQHAYTEWTARVIARFLNTLSDKLKEG